MKVVIIPARGGSKRIPRKNLRDFCGMPMIGHAIELAHKSKLFDEVIVSTDDIEIKSVSEQYGAKVPFIRSAHLSHDSAPTLPVIQDAIRRIEHYAKTEVSTICCIYPCTPLLTAEHLRLAAISLSDKPEKLIFPVLKYNEPILRALKIDTDGNLVPMWPEFVNVPTQALEALYQDAGQFYLGSRNCWMERANLHSNACPIIINSGTFVDIDTEEDWLRSEMLFNQRSSG